MIEECKLCKEEQTPWEVVPELNGHICIECSLNLSSLNNEFDKYKDKAKRIGGCRGNTLTLDYLKKITIVLINRWNNKS